MPLPNDYKYSPLPEYLELDCSDIHGYGVFAKTSIKNLVILPISHRKIGCEVIRQDYGGWVNHSDDPNCILIPVKRIEDGRLVGCAETKTDLYAPIVARPINKGEEITLDYNKSICGY